MIGFLRGTIVSWNNSVATIDVLNMGHEVHVIADSCDVGKEVALWIHEHAPQDAPHELYGFLECEQRDLFRRLIEIKGVGPKVAMRIVASKLIVGGKVVFITGHPDGRAKQLCNVRGVGATLADRIVEAMQ